jgi:4-amino-4-deoxy-L-arabinose transferase-like glycosyltransferase
MMASSNPRTLESSHPSLRRAVNATLLAGAAALLVAWALTVPIFESPDEPAHWQYARYLHDHWRLPFYRAGFEEANSPPLYYLAIAPLAIPSKLPPMVVVEDARGDPISLAPPRTFLNTDRDRDWYRPVWWARLVTAAMSVLTVYVCYRIGTTAGDWRTGLITAAFVACLPQFSFGGATMNNDVLVALFAALVTFGSTRIIRKGFTWRRAVLTAIALACAFLSKISAIALAAPFALALVEAPGRWPACMRRWWVFLVTLAIVLPWTARNVMLYGDPFAVGAMRTAVAHLITDRSLVDPYFVREFPTRLAASFVGVFGWASVKMPKPAYFAFGLFVLASFAGLVRGLLAGNIDRRLLRVLVLTVLAVLSVIVYHNLSFTQPQGRYLFPALPAIALLVALGLTHLPPLSSSRHPAVPVGLCVAGLALFNAWALVSVLVPAYYPPLTRDLEPGVRALFPDAAYGMRLVGRDLRFQVAADDPGWVVLVDADSSAYALLEFEVASEWPGAPVVTGVVRFSTTDRGLDRARQLDFTWRANGQSQTIHIPVAQHPGWRGTIAHLRIDPFEHDTSAMLRREIRLGRIRLLAR